MLVLKIIARIQVGWQTAEAFSGYTAAVTKTSRMELGFSDADDQIVCVSLGFLPCCFEFSEDSRNS